MNMPEPTDAEIESLFDEAEEWLQLHSTRYQAIREMNEAKQWARDELDRMNAEPA